MIPLHRKILAQHKGVLDGALRVLPFRSKALGISKPVFVYEPPGLRKHEQIHLLYLFRGHEREFVNLDEDTSRTVTSVQDIDGLIKSGQIPPVLVIMPGLNSTDNTIPSLGINMVQPSADSRSGLGTGMFWNFLTLELTPYIEARYQSKLRNAKRLAAGFSLGGYTSSLLATAMPGYLDHAGMYDGLFMYDSQIDTRTNSLDKVWCKASIFNEALGLAVSRKPENLTPWNPAELVMNADPVNSQLLKKTMYWVRSASGDGVEGNRDRSRYFVDILKNAGIVTGFNRVPLHPEAKHTWHWNDRFLKLFLLNTIGELA